ncbi:AbfB domain-containing protein [Glycomyces dulcitolivorans]|uniref:AbfB domain-containing protein n=1 Tax=Glycomyces dulcitolivorans TaxID=2200759 RepID=UPI000DD43D87|nr:AbfB domain-containing protein [Glycomyces dulcitolivorans]
MSQLDTGRLGRRPLLKGAAVTGGLALAGLGGSALTAPQYAEAQTVGIQAVGHPAMLHTQADLAYIAANLTAEPWLSGWNMLTANGHSQSTWTPSATAVITRGGSGTQNYALLYRDAHAAYQNALRWRIAGTTANRDAAVAICNAWSSTLTEINGSTDALLCAGLQGYQFANAAELIRDAPGFDLAAFQAMALAVFHPLTSGFLNAHNNTCATHYWANWDLAAMNAELAIGVLCDDDTIIDQALDYFWNGVGNGSIRGAIPFTHDDGLAQWQESGRDQAHAVLGIGLMATFMETAWNQGIDLYSADDNAFAKACEYVASYNLGNDVPYTTYSWGSGTTCAYNEQTAISAAGRGTVRPVWAMIHHHYYSRRGLDLPNVAAMAASVASEGGGGDYGSTSGGYDALGFGGLLYSRARATVPYSRIQSYNFQTHYWRHAGFAANISTGASPAEDTWFQVGAGLADRADDCVSFESVNLPGYYLRRNGSVLKLEEHDGSAAFAASATFRAVAGLADASWTSFQLYDDATRYVRHGYYILRADVIGSGAYGDATFRITA